MTSEGLKEESGVIKTATSLPVPASELFQTWWHWFYPSHTFFLQVSPCQNAGLQA